MNHITIDNKQIPVLFSMRFVEWMEKEGQGDEGLTSKIKMLYKGIEFGARREKTEAIDFDVFGDAIEDDPEILATMIEIMNADVGKVTAAMERLNQNQKPQPKAKVPTKAGRK